MKMIKLLGSIIILFTSSIIGFILSANLKKRASELREIQSSTLLLQNEIMFTFTALPEAFLKISQHSKGIISKLYLNIGDKLLNNVVDSVFDAFTETFNELKDDMNLKSSDINVLLDFAKGLGKSDIDGQKKIFSLLDNNLRNCIEEADCHIMKNSKLYKTLGFSFGAIVVIMLI
jgi:stage III sporulation protein AB